MEIAQPILNINDKLPKYQQFVNILLHKMNHGELKKGDKLPSIVESSLSYGLSRDTVLRAYKKLYNKGVITSIYRKGYFVSQSSFGKLKKNVLVAVSELTSANYMFYERLSKEMDQNKMQCDLRIYNNSLDRLENVIREAEGNYHTFILEPQMHALEKILQLSQSKIVSDEIIILNDETIGPAQYGRHVFLNIEKAIHESLKKLSLRFDRYHTINLVLPAKEYFPYKLITGFFNYCDQNDKQGNLLEEINTIAQGNAYILIDEESLFDFLNLSNLNQTEIGTDVGVLTLFERQYLKHLKIPVSSLNWFNDRLVECIMCSIQNSKYKCQKSDVELTIRESL